MTKIPKSLLDGMCIQVEPYIGNIDGAIIAKMGYNQTRPMRHGGKQF